MAMFCSRISSASSRWVQEQAGPPGGRCCPVRSQDPHAKAVAALERFIAGEIAVHGCLPGDHRVVQELSRAATKMMVAAGQDPLFRKLGVKLPDHCEICVILSSEENGFVNPGNPERIIAHSGLLNLLDTPELRLAFVGHEISHFIHSQIIEAAKRPPIRERFGEAIWEDRVLGRLSDSDPKVLLRKLLSRPEELWADTRGCHFLLNAIGVAPEAVTSMLLRFRGACASDARWEERALLAALPEALRSHPPSEHRVWTSRNLAAKECYPASFEPRRSPAHEQDPALPLESRTRRMVDLLVQGCPLMEWFLSPENFSNYVPYGIVCADKPHVSKKLKNLPQEDRLLCAMILGSMGVFNDGLFNQVFELEHLSIESRDADPAEHGRFMQLLNKVSQEDVAVTPLHMEAGRAKLAIWLADLVLETLKDLNISPLQTLVILNLFGHGDVPVTVSKYQELLRRLAPDDLLSLSSAFPVAPPSRAILWEALRSFCIGRSINLFLPIYAESWRNELIGRLYVSNEQAIDVRPAPPYFPRDIGWSLRRLVKDAFSSLLTADKFRTAEEALEWIQRFEQMRPLPESVAGECGDPAFVGSLALEVVAHFSTGGRPALEILRLVADCGWELDPPYGEAKAGAESNGRTIESIAKATMNLGGTKKILEIVREFEILWPIFCDSLFRGADFKKQYQYRIEPDRMSSQNALINPHDRWAYGEDKSTLRPELVRGQKLIKTFLRGVDKGPCLFSEKVWGDIAREAVRSLSDLEYLVEFISERYRHPALDKMPIRERNRAQSLSAVVGTGLDILSEGGLIDPKSQSDLSRIQNLIEKAPRCASRNRIVVRWIRFLCSCPSPDAAVLQRGLRLLETEPFQEMLHQHLQELRGRGNQQCRRLEGSIEGLEKVVIPVSAWEGDRNSIEAIIVRGRSRYRELAGKASRLPDGYALAVVIKSDIEKPIQWPPAEGLHPLQTISGLRNAAARQLAADGVQVTRPIEFMAQAVRQAEECGQMAWRTLGVDDPAQKTCLSFLPGEARTRDIFFAHLNEIILALQPIPTPLRDSWILKAYDEISAGDAVLALRDVLTLQGLLYLPESVERLGEGAVKLYTQEHTSEKYPTLDNPEEFLGGGENQFITPIASI